MPKNTFSQAKYNIKKGIKNIFKYDDPETRKIWYRLFDEQESHPWVGTAFERLYTVKSFIRMADEIICDIIMAEEVCKRDHELFEWLTLFSLETYEEISLNASKYDVIKDYVFLVARLFISFGIVQNFKEFTCLNKKTAIKTLA